MICFPLDNTEYVAKDLGAWFATRTRGVFSADGNLSVTANGEMNVTVSSGLAWLKMGSNWGVVISLEESQDLTISTADGALSRYDMICLRMNKNTNESELIVKKGSYSQSPTYPAIVRDINYDEIYIAAIKVNAGATKITAGDITDLRLNETYCGIMRDGVTGIPTDQLFAQWQSWYEENTAGAQNSFTEWFDHIKDQLSTDAAGNLQNQIDELKPYTVSYILQSTISEESRLGMVLKINEDLVLKDGTQVLLSADTDVICSQYVNFSGVFTLETPSKSIPIYSLNVDSLDIDLQKGKSLYLVYSEEKSAFIAQLKCASENSTEILEAGSNANGSYIKYSNGTMQCYKSVPVNLSIIKAWGTGFIENENSGTGVSLGNWPINFTDIPITTVTVYGEATAGVMFTGIPTVTSIGKVNLFRPVAAPANLWYYIAVSAFGHWA